jgi:plasmid stabilization system protein ParE
MARKVRILKKAASNLEGILEYLDRDFGKPTAIQFFKRAETLFSILINQPEIGTLYRSEKRIFSFPIEK